LSRFVAKDGPVRASLRPVVAVLTVLTLLVTSSPAAARPTGGLQWRPCADDDTAQCAALTVPVDRADPYSATIQVAVARRPATDRARRIGTLVVNPGGPGGSGVDFALEADWFFSPALRARFDIVGFDPRGVRRSSPVRCSAAVLDAAPSPLLTGPAAYAAATMHNRRLAADCRRRSGPVFGHADTLSVVQDLEALRAALAEPKISFYGASYGTLLGQQYAERYPGRVRAVVLDSVMDHSIGTGAFLADGTDAAQDAFDQFAAWCARDTGCVLRGRDVRALWATLTGRASRGELRDPYDPARRMTAYDLVQVAFGSFYDPQWHSLAHFLREADLASRAVRPRGAADTVVDDPFAAVFCADWALPMRGYPDYAAQMAALRRRAPQMVASPLALAATVGCLDWPTPVRNPQREPAPAVVPTLLVNARHDPATPYAWARSVTTQLGPRATLATYDGSGHVVYGRTPCVTGIVDRYLLDLRRPAAGTSCAGVVPDPFGVGRRAPLRRPAWLGR
jgi:pimeloyl-ACP methyl ester carboxylesterase